MLTFMMERDQELNHLIVNLLYLEETQNNLNLDKITISSAASQCNTLAALGAIAPGGAEPASRLLLRPGVAEDAAHG